MQDVIPLRVLRWCDIHAISTAWHAIIIDYLSKSAENLYRASVETRTGLAASLHIPIDKTLQYQHRIVAIGWVTVISCAGSDYYC